LTAVPRSFYPRSGFVDPKWSKFALSLVNDLNAAHRTDGLGIVQEFVTAAAKAADMAELRRVIDEVCGELDIDYYALVNHIRFGRPTSEYVRLTNYPGEWVALIRQADRVADPVLRAAERTSTGFLWQHIERYTKLTEHDRAIFRQASRHGLGEGFTVPNHVPGEAFGSCHFAVQAGKSFPKEHIPAIQSIGTFGFEAARRLIAAKAEPSERYLEPAPLTDRQRECLIFAARGKSDSVIAQLLAIRPRTVNEHIEAAKRRYCVATRSQLMVRALFRSEILYTEVLE
jgi:LuxR family quorum-sensing system transcriptional regulator CciR